jgi:elongator complex protein 1
MSPPDLGSAMAKILDTKEKQGIDKAEAALKYLIFLADVNQLYDFALGVYDFPLVLMVAQHSQKDPREYLPFLNELQKLEKYYQRFTIDDYLSRHESALNNIALAGEEHFDEALEYTKKHKLYTHAMDVFKSNNTQYLRVLVAFAEYLVDRNEFEEAGMLYVLANQKPLALQAYRQGCMWREALSLARELEMDDSLVKDLAQELKDELYEKKVFREAAVIALEDLGNVKNAVEILSKGNIWGDAIRLAKRNNYASLIDAVIQPIALEAYNHTKDDVQEMNVTFEKHVTRLREVRIKKEQQKNEPMGPEDSTLSNIDVMSDTSSMATTLMSGTIKTRSSMMSTATARTAKQRRKMERKKAAGRLEGFEDEFLIESLRKSIEKSNSMRRNFNFNFETLQSI